LNRENKQIKSIDTFYVLDFDRCLGNVDASFGLLVDIIKGLSAIDAVKIQLAYKDAENAMVSFSVLDFIKKNCPDINLDFIKKVYSERAKSIQSSLLEPGSIKFIDFLNLTNRDFCIMSYGEKNWQNLKILSTGIGNLPRLIVSSHKKDSIIASWFDTSNHKFIVPKVCFLDNQPRLVREIILIDDKLSVFDNLPDGARGYLVIGSANRAQSIKKVPLRVECVNHVDEIIDLEIRHSKK